MKGPMAGPSDYGVGVRDASIVEVVVVVWVLASGVPLAAGASLVDFVSVVVVDVSRFWQPRDSAAAPAIKKPTRVSVLFIGCSSSFGPIAGRRP